MAVTISAPQNYDVDKVANAIAIKLGSPERFKLLGVALTDVDEPTLKWKYDEQWKEIRYYESTPNEDLARQLKGKLCSKGIKNLEDDPLNSGTNNCKYVFVRTLLLTEVSQPLYGG